jgi:6-phosphogluconate dehydrogenase
MAGSARPRRGIFRHHLDKKRACGNSYYRDDITRAERLVAQDIDYVDCGTSGGVWGLERGYCLMIGGETEVVTRLDPIFKTIAPGAASAEPTPAVTPAPTPLPTGTCTAGLVGQGIS